MCSFNFQQIFGEIVVFFQAWKRYAADHTGFAFIWGLSAFLSLHVVLEPVKSMQYKCVDIEL